PAGLMWFVFRRRHRHICDLMSTRNLEQLLAAIRDEARQIEVRVDEDVYRTAGRSPLDPILYAGSLDAPVAFVGRDLGREEVIAGQPLIGGAGRRVRSVLYRRIMGSEPARDDRRLEPMLTHALLTNTVPYKPVGNKCYAPSVRERFRPFLAELLTCHWKGEYVITLGTEAFRWFAPYAPAGVVMAFCERPDRFEAEVECEVTTVCGTHRRTVNVAPLPHPSPLNQAYLALFPGLLESRLRRVFEP